MKNIKVINHQTIDHETDIIEEHGSGSCREKNGKFYVIYDVVSNEGASKVTVIAGKDNVKIKRSGDVNSEMHYESGKTTAFKYNTPYGAIDMEINTIRIHNGLTEQGGTLKIVYSLVMQGMATYNDTEIIVS